MKKVIILRRIFHRDKWCILISFKYDGELGTLVNQIKGNCYSNTLKGWYTDDNEESLKEIFRKFKDKAEIDISVSKKVCEKQDEYVDGFHPGKCLFEGQSGGRYSVESV